MVGDSYSQLLLLSGRGESIIARAACPEFNFINAHISFYYRAHFFKLPRRKAFARRGIIFQHHSRSLKARIN
jgi:hypothetical protein